MDRHVRWLRRHILASVAKQTATTFCVVAAITFAAIVAAGQSLTLAGTAALAAGQLVAFVRVVHSARSNPVNYGFIKRFIENPFHYQATPLDPSTEIHESAQALTGFLPAATISDPNADPTPHFDVLHDPSGVVVASVSRASGAITLISELHDDRLLVTDGRALPPHERVISNRAPDGSAGSVISAHRAALIQRHQPRPCGNAADVVLASLQLEHDVYAALGPVLGPFFDLEAKNRNWFRIVAPLKATELAGIDMLAPKPKAAPEPRDVLAPPTPPAALQEAFPAAQETADSAAQTPAETTITPPIAEMQPPTEASVAVPSLQLQPPVLADVATVEELVDDPDLVEAAGLAVARQPVPTPKPKPKPMMSPPMPPIVAPTPTITVVEPPTTIPIALPTPAIVAPATPLVVKLADVDAEPASAMAPAPIALTIPSPVVVSPTSAQPATAAQPKRFAPAARESIFAPSQTPAITPVSRPTPVVPSSQPRDRRDTSLADFIHDAPDSLAGLDELLEPHAMPELR